MDGEDYRLKVTVDVKWIDELAGLIDTHHELMRKVRANLREMEEMSAKINIELGEATDGSR